MSIGRYFNKQLLIILVLMILLGGLFLSGCAEDTDEGLTLATPAEWLEREDGLEAFQAHYDFTWPEEDIMVVELGLGYETVGTGEADVGTGDATEGRLEKYDLRVLEDDQDFFPAYNPAPVVREEILEAHPEIEDIMKALSERYTLDTLIELNRQVTIEEKQPENVAREFLKEEGLIDEDAEADEEQDGPPIVVSSKTFAEALTMGAMTVQILEDRGYQVVDETGLGEVAIIREALEAGEIDLYWEYTGTGLFNIKGHDEVIADPERCYQVIKEWDQAENDIIWLDYAPANNTFVIFISEEVYQEYGFTTLSELTEYVDEQ